jgi:SAM-dependent methyltransferase
MDDWIDYYDSTHTIYVNARHRDVHFRTIAQDLAQYVTSADQRVLDYGCGEALHAGLVAARAQRLTLVEPAPGVRARIAARFKDHPAIEVAAPEDLARCHDGAFDVVIMHSVAQYLTPDELDATLRMLRRLLAPGGLFVLGDVLKPGTAALTDALALLAFGARHGFFFAAALGLARTFFSSYWRLRSALGLTRYAAAEMIEKLGRAGLSGRRAERNIGHNQARMTFLANPK